MSDAPHINGKGGRVHLDPTINLGHIISVVLTLAAVVAGWATLDARVATLERDQRANKTETRDSVVGAETRLMNRINDERARLDQTQVRTADDIREIKQIVRDGFRDLDQKLDRKMDKPGR